MTADSLLALFALVAFLVFFYGPWQGVCTDVARQVVFEQRDKVFDMARSGRIDFNSKEYRHIRVGLEKTIRFAHELTSTRLLYLALVIPSVEKAQARSEFLSAIGSIEDETLKRDLARIEARAYTALILMVIAKSLPCLFLLPLLFIAWILSRLTVTISTLCKKYLMIAGRLIQVEAECV